MTKARVGFRLTGVGAAHRGARLGGMALVGAALLGIAAPAQACPFGPRPTDASTSWISVCAGSEPGQDKFITYRQAVSALDNSYTLAASSASQSLGGTGYVNTEAAVARQSFGDIYLNPDLHAAVYGSVAAVGNSVGDVDGIASASFHDVVTIKALPPGMTGGFFFTLDFDIDGILTSTASGTNSSPSSEGWASASFNLGITELGNDTNFDGDGVGWRAVGGDGGSKSASILVGLFVELGHSYILRGDLDASGTGRGDAAAAAVFGADFMNSAKFGGIHAYTDSSMTTEVAGYAIESGFGFDYRLNAPLANDVPEPASLALLATGWGMLGFWRRAGGRARAS